MTEKQTIWIENIRDRLVNAFKTRIALNNPMIVGFMLGTCLSIAELEALYLFLESTDNFNEFIYECMKDANAQCDKEQLFKLLQFLNLYCSKKQTSMFMRVTSSLRKLSWKVRYRQLP